MYIKLHLCRVLEASGSILVDIERYGICCIRSWQGVMYIGRQVAST